VAEDGEGEGETQEVIRLWKYLDPSERARPRRMTASDSRPFRHNCSQQ